nr:hypothetical protein [uncultured Dyadobacter sp.]
MQDGRERCPPVKRSFNGHKTLSQGAATTIWAATSEKLKGIGGVYCQDNEVVELVVIPNANEEEPVKGVDDLSNMNGVAAYALDEQNAKNLWTLSEQLTGVTFKI